MIPKELEAKILRYHLAEKWPVGTIARQLGVHHDTVERVLCQAGVPVVKKIERPSMVDPFLPFVTDTLEEYPRLPASRLFEMVRERGYPGQPDHFRHIVSRLRPRPPAEAYLRLRTLPGEQAQVDWAHFGKLAIGRARRALMAFVVVLSWSRRIFLRFFLDQRMGSFLRGHVEAFEAFGGCPRVCLYDNLKSAVLERKGDAIRFNPTLLELAAHYRYEPRPVAPYRGNEKARVERAIRYVRGSFFAARRFEDLDDLNRQSKEWCEGIAADRPCPEDREMTVREAFEQERPRLLPLPDNPFVTDERVEVKVGKTPYVRFDLNDYSVPHTLVRRTLVVLASEKTVRVLDGNEVQAEHERSYDKGDQVEDPAHIAGLQDHKRQARRHRGLDRLRQAAPSSGDLMIGLAERGVNLGSATAALLRLLDRYGARELEAAIKEALTGGAPHPNSVRQVLERNAKARGLAPPVPVDLPDDPRVREITIEPHDLKTYDALKEVSTDDEEEQE
jgi:transposase